jgi:hypothetical protein
MYQYAVTLTVENVDKNFERQKFLLSVYEAYDNEGDIEVHGTIQASGELGLKSSDGDPQILFELKKDQVIYSLPGNAVQVVELTLSLWAFYLFFSL